MDERSNRPLTAAELREGLALVLAELRALPRDRYAKAERLGWLQAHIETVVGDSPHGIEPIYGLQSLRHAQQQAPEAGGAPPRPAGPAPEPPVNDSADPDPRWQQ